MKKFIIYSFVFTALSLQAQNKPIPVDAQPTVEERLQLMTAQRDTLLRELQKQKAIKDAEDALAAMQTLAGTLGVKYNCAAWKPDFTCEKAPVTETK